MVLATSSKNGIPHAIYVMSLGFINNNILIGLCQRKTTFNNLKNNNRVVLISKYKNQYYRLNGTVEIFSAGKYLALAKKMSNPPLPLVALLVTIKEVFDLDKGIKIDCHSQQAKA